MINSSTDKMLLSQHKHLWFLLLSYSMVISISNWYDARLISIFGLIISPGTLTFPISFLLSDSITEVYGYKNARRAILAAFLFNILFLAFGQLITHLPSPSVSAQRNALFDELLSINTWIILGSFCSYLISEPLNSYLIAKLKIKFKGEYIGIRFIISTIFAAFVDSVIFILIAFHNVVDKHILITMIFNVWIIKSCVEIMGLPVSVRATKWLKKVEQLDIYDHNTNFNPFILDVSYEQNANEFTKNRGKK